MPLGKRVRRFRVDQRAHAGRILKLEVAAGTMVKYFTLLVMEAMKMEHVLRAIR
jgi:acetyl/propionyl-CoA carboxylase alpha subunit